MAEPTTPPDFPGAAESAEELEESLRKATGKSRDRQEDQEIAADDAGGSTLAEESDPKGRRS